MSNNIFRPELVEEAEKRWRNLRDEIGKNVEVLVKFRSETAALPSQYVTHLTKSKEALEGLTNAQARAIVATEKTRQEQERTARELEKTNRATQRAAKSTKELTLETAKVNEVKKENNKQTRLQAKVELGLANAYDKLNNEIREAEKNYRGLAVSLGKTNPATIKARKEVLKLRNQLDGVNQPIKHWNSNVGNYMQGLRNLAGALGWAGLTFAIVNGLSATWDTIKVYDALLRSLNQITGSQQQASAEFRFAADISERLGLNLRQTTDDYIKFLASVKNTNLEGKKARDIFESVSKVASSLGLSAEETSGTLRALNQIISKGKVQAEELRGQLGDRLPGAFQVMARALGVTTAKLDEMLKNGELLADEVLPKFAKELEKTFGVENVDRIDTLVSATNRVSSAWDKLILSIENGDGAIARFIKGTLNKFAEGLERTKNIIRGFEGELEDITNKSFQKFMDVASGRTFQTDGLEKLLDKRKLHLKSLEDELQKYKMFVPANKAERIMREEEIIRNQKLIASSQGRIKAIETLIKKQKDEKNSLIDKIILLDKSLKQDELEAMNLIKLRKLYDDLNKSKSDEDGVESRQKENSLIKDLISEYERHLRQRKVLEKDLGEDFADGLRDKLQKDIDNIEPIEVPIETKIYTDLDFTPEEFALLENQFNRLGELYGLDASKFSKLFDGKKNTVNDYVDAAAEAVTGLYSLMSYNYDKELEDLDEVYSREKELHAEGTSARIMLDEEYDRKKRQIRIKQAQSEKSQAIFGAIINTATAVTKALGEGGIALAAIVGALGAIEIGIIASQPLPQFYDGTEDTGRGGSVDNRGGFNAVLHPHERVVSREDNNKMHGYSNKEVANIIDNYHKGSLFEVELNKMLSTNGILKEHSYYPIIKESKGLTPETFNKGINELKNTINGKQAGGINFDERGMEKYIIQGNTKKIIMNNRFNSRINRI